LPGREGVSHQVVRLIHPLQHRMEQERSEIEREEHGRQVLLAMAIGMFERRAFGFGVLWCSCSMFQRARPACTTASSVV
jgi:hypothetical protein